MNSVRDKLESLAKLGPVGSKELRKVIQNVIDTTPFQVDESDASTSRITPQKRQMEKFIETTLDKSAAASTSRMTTKRRVLNGQIENAPTLASSPAREKVNTVRNCYNHLLNEKIVNKATQNIDKEVKKDLMLRGVVTNQHKRIGSVPGIHIGDTFRYKTELEVVGLHFKPACGIDYMSIGGDNFATCIVASDEEGDLFASWDHINYLGEGGNFTTRDVTKLRDQKMVRGNLAMRNSMIHGKHVRVVRRTSKKYIYIGLYLVEQLEQETFRGKRAYRFHLRKVSSCIN